MEFNVYMDLHVLVGKNIVSAAKTDSAIFRAGETLALARMRRHLFVGLFAIRQLRRIQVRVCSAAKPFGKPCEKLVSTTRGVTHC